MKERASKTICCRSWAELSGCLAGACTMSGDACSNHCWLARHCVVAADTRKSNDLSTWTPEGGNGCSVVQCAS